MELVNALELLQINAVSKGWVDSVWDAEFVDAEPLGPALEENTSGKGTDVFRQVYKRLLPFSSDEQGNVQNVWMVLGESGIPIKTLVAVLSYYILGGKSTTATVEQRLKALQAASVYLLLLKVPGSVANQVFHQVLFEASIEIILKCWPKESGKKRKKETAKSSQGDARCGKRAKPARKDQEEMDLDEDDEEDHEGEMFFSAQDLVKLRNEIETLVKTLLGFLKTFSLKDRPQSVENCIRIFTELTNFEPVVGEISFSGLETLPELGFHGLWLLCLSHGEGNECLRRVFHRLLYVILMMRKGEMTKPSLLVISQAVVATRNYAISFVCHVVDQKKEAALPVLKILLQHICHQMVEKTEYRTHGAQAVSRLLAKVPNTEYATFIKWLFAYSIKTKVAYRMFALDVAMALLEQSERDPDSLVPAELGTFLTHRFLVQNLLFGRRSDISPTVRAHALHCLSRCLELDSPNTTKCVQELFSASKCLIQRSILTQKTALPFKTIENTNAKILVITDAFAFNTAQETMGVLKRRVSDSKTNVRKAAIEVTSLLKHSVIMCSEENLTLLSERCRDPAVSVKKKALQCLTDLLVACPDRSLVQVAWLRGVIVVVVDSESSVQEKALECLDMVIIEHIKARRTFEDTAQKLAWDLLELLCDQCRDLSRYFSKAFILWSQQKKFTSSFVNSLITHTKSSHSTPAWMLLSKVAGSCPSLHYETILDGWEKMIKMDVNTSCHIMSVMGDVASHLNEDTRHRVIEDLMTLLKCCEMPLEVIHAGVDTLCRLCRAENTEENLNKHCGELVSICESYLSSVILNERGAENLNEDMVVKHLYTLGTASLHCPSQVGKRVFLLVQSVLTSSVELLTAEGTKELPATQPLSQFKPTSMPTVVRAQAVATLGKLCLQHENLANRCVPAFARELEVGQELAVRSNVVVVLCDLCVRYTNTVTRYIPNISACLRDPEGSIREKALIMLTNLLQEEFVKWKDSLFFRYVAVLVDPDPEIASLCEYCLLDRLLKKNPLMFSQHFIECIFHFNSYNNHKKYNKFPQTDGEKARFSLKGAQNKVKRFKIYKFLLEHFTDEQRFNTTSRISKEVLAGFVDGELPLDADGAELLADTFDVLSLREMKLSSMTAQDGADEPQDEQAAVVKVIQKKLVSQVQKKNFIENVIPIVIALKSMLEEERSPVLRHLMGYLQVTTQDYRNELKEVFAADEQLAAELEFNLRLYEQHQQEEPLTSFILSKTDEAPASVVRRHHLYYCSTQHSPAKKNYSFLKISTLCSDYFFAHSWHSLECQEWFSNSLEGVPRGF
uniref:Condensin-2 complex subunit D3 n=1 Tax=Denticeps clupeoides TaxID=299321 RepID=A0AAY4AAM2_9TELE